MFTITLPVPQDKLAAELKRARDELTELNSQARAVQDVIVLLQNACKHPTTTKGSSCGEDWVRCKVCDKEL